VLSVDLGILLWIKYPRENVYFEMDVRPASARRGPNGEEPIDEKWEPLHTEDQRVMAGWLYHSWCWPAGIPYAVALNGDTDADDVVYDKNVFGDYKVLTQQALASILGMPKSHVNRATHRLVARKKLTIDEDGRVYPVAKPVMSKTERDALLNADSPLGQERSTIPVELRQMVEEALDGYEEYLAAEAAEGREVTRTDYRASVLEVCKAFNDKLQQIRTDRKWGIEQVCSEIPTLLARSGDTKQPSSSSQSLLPQKPSPRSQEPENDDGRGSINELYAAGAGKGALAKLPARKQRVAAWVRGVAEQCGISTDADAIDQLIRACHEAAPDIRADEIAGGVKMKAAQAAKKDNPIGFLITAVPNVFKDGGLKRIREQLQQERAAEETAAAIAQSRARQVEREQELVQRVDAAWAAMPDAEKRRRIKRAKKDLQGDHGSPLNKTFRLLTPAQQDGRAEVECRSDLRAEIEAELSQGAG
jgi:DNA-binding IclR family transcriptional regulator